MLSRRAVFTLGLSRLAESLDTVPGREPDAPVAPAPPAPPARRSWPRGDDAGLWAPIAARLPPTAGGGLDLDEHDLDLAALPFDDASFAAARSTFGPIFSSDGRAAIDEMFRVVAPGGVVAFTAWTSLGVVGRLLRLGAAHDPPPPGMPPPLTWGREERLRQELERHSDDARLEPGTLTCRFGSSDEAVRRLVASLGPLAAAPRQDELRAGVAHIVEQLAVAEDAGVCLEARYVLAVATRAPVLY